MPAYHFVMIILSGLSMIALFFYCIIKGRSYKVCSVAKTDFNKKLTDEDFRVIQKICDGWFRTSKLWGTLHYILAANATVASIITVYIASTKDFIQMDIILYSILALVFSMISLILRCDIKATIDRNAYNKIQAKIFYFKLGKCTEEDLINCFIECESKIAEFYVH